MRWRGMRGGVGDGVGGIVLFRHWIPCFVLLLYTDSLGFMREALR